MNKNNYRFSWTDREENLCLGFVKRLLLIRLSGVDIFLIKNCINVKLLSNFGFAFILGVFFFFK